MDNVFELVSTTLTTILSNHGFLAIFTGVFFTGENAAIATFALASQGFINPYVALSTAFLASLSSDVFWFFIAEFVIKRHYPIFVEKLVKRKTRQPILRFVDRHFFVALICIKFLIGMRLALTMYIVLKNTIPFWKKVALNSFGTILFMSTLFPVGWYLGKGISGIASIQHSIVHTMTVIIGVLIIISMIAPRALTRYITKLDTRE